MLDILFPSNYIIHKSHVAFTFGLQTLKSIDFSKIYQLKGMKPKNKGHANFYECSDLAKKYI